MNMHGIKPFFCFILILLSSCKKEPGHTGSLFEKRAVDLHPSPLPLSPAESIKKIQLPPGYSVELVAAEPLIRDPVGMAWDGNGNLYVVEMSTFMMDARATDQYKPYNRIVRLVDTDWDGRMDRSTIFIDSLVLPRVVLPVRDELIVGVTNVQHLYAYIDTNDDGRADQKRLVFKNDAIDSRNMEHQNGGLIWNLDNWIYPSRDNLRFKYKEGRLIADTLIDNMIGQWGMTSDNYGRLFYSEAGPGLPVVQFNQMPAYGSLNFSDQYPADFAVPWPIMSTVDAQGGPQVLRPSDSTLNQFTSGCGQSIFRGDRMPEDMQGDYFIAEPVARVIKRGKVIDRDGKRMVENVYQGQDWLASADFNFRPVNTYTGPDGCFYIVDMYRGIIQEGEFAEEDSWLNRKIKALGLEKNKGYGRIYRVVHRDYRRDAEKPRLLEKSAMDLLPYLGHPNGWWRDQAQQLLVLKQDKSIYEPLLQMVRNAPGALIRDKALARIHALWTLDGLGLAHTGILSEALKDEHAQVRKAAVWIGEAWIRQNDTAFINRLGLLKDDPSPDVRIQLYLSLRTSKNKKAESIVRDILRENPDNEMIRYSHSVFEESYARAEAEKARISRLSPAEKQLIALGATRYKQLCSTCHGMDGKGISIGGAPRIAPPLAGSPRVRGDKIMLIQILLYGLKGPVDNISYPGSMLPYKQQDDEWIASVLSYIRNSADLGNASSIVTREEVEDIRATAAIEDGHIPDLRMLEIYKLGRGEAQNWSKGKPGSGGQRWGGHFRSMKDSTGRN
ncbi:MAG TPA: cytochrome C [Saprospiraceae bacterium]|nr:cytochrome C [Saprospiraceae bacterium]